MHKEKIIKRLHHQAMACLVLFAFMFASFAQAFHQHEDTDAHTAYHTTTIAKHVHDCNICEHFTQQHGKLFYSQPVALLPEPAVLTVNNQTGSIAINYAFTLQGFTNKGPPAFIS